MEERMSRIRKSLTICIMLLLVLMTAGCGSKNDMEISAEDLSFLDELTEHEKEILGEGTLEMYPSLSEEMKEDEREKMEMSSRCSRNFAVVTGGDNAGLYLDGGEVVLKDGEIIPVYAEKLMDEDENGQ